MLVGHFPLSPLSLCSRRKNVTQSEHLFPEHIEIPVAKYHRLPLEFVNRVLVFKLNNSGRQCTVQTSIIANAGEPVSIPEIVLDHTVPYTCL